MSDRGADTGEERADFGFRRVSAAEKPGMVREVFDSVATRYDLMNDLMSLGVHRRWKRAMVARLDARPDTELLDLGGGTGDIAFAFRARGGGRATVCDLTLPMIEVGRDRAIDRNLTEGIAWVCGDAEQLPFPDRSFAACTIAFALRNVTRIDAVLAEARRILKPGGKFLCLEFSKVALPAFAWLYDRYSFAVLPLLGRVVAGDADSYRYLVESIRRFPPQDELAARMSKAGFERVSYANFQGGIVALHSGRRL